MFSRYSLYKFRVLLYKIRYHWPSILRKQQQVPWMERPVHIPPPIYLSIFPSCGPGSSVGIVTELRAGRSGDRIPVGRVFPSVQTGPEAHPASCTMGTGSFPGVNYGRDVLLTTHPLLVPWSWKSRSIPLPTLWATTGPVTGTLFLMKH